MGQVEIDDYCQKILEKHFPKAKRWRDICTVSANDIRRRCGAIDLICGGFPCQDISSAGKGKGANEGERSGLWREMWRLIKDLRPDWVLLENVPALRTRGADSVLSAMEAIGYTCWALVVGAWAVGAPHKRDRVFIVAYRNSKRLKFQRECGLSHTTGEKQRDNLDGCSSPELVGDTAGKRERESDAICAAEPVIRQARNSTRSTGNALSDADSKRLWNQQGRRKQKRTSPSFAFPNLPGRAQHDWEERRTTKSTLGFTTDGLPIGLALKATGNALLPQIPYLIGKWIMQANG